MLLVQTKKYNFSELSAENVFGSKAYNQHLMKGPIIGLEFNGKQCIAKCYETLSPQYIGTLTELGNKKKHMNFLKFILLFNSFFSSLCKP